MKMSRTKSQHNIGIFSVESYSCHCHCYCHHHRHLHCHQYKHCCVIFIESCILHWFLSGTWRINGSQGPIHPTPGTALEELRTRPTMHRKHLMECSTGSSRWKTNEWRHYTKLADNISLQLLPSVVPPSPIYGICRECQEILTYALRGNHSGWS